MDGYSLSKLGRWNRKRISLRLTCLLNFFLEHLEEANVRERTQGSGDFSAILTAANLLLLCVEKFYLLRRKKLSLTLQELIF